MGTANLFLLSLLSLLPSSHRHDQIYSKLLLWSPYEEMEGGEGVDFFLDHGMYCRFDSLI